jgi:hypothetical protein
VFGLGPLRIRAHSSARARLKIGDQPRRPAKRPDLPAPDEGVDTSKNLEMFARCHEVLRDGGRIALFPEGISHDEPRLQPLRTGAARIALESERRFGPLGVRIVPIGLLFDERGTFRTRTLVVVGELDLAAG